MSDPTYSGMERIALILNVVVAIAGLGYALMLVNEVYGADTGTPRMQEITRAVREGADAYLKRQFTAVGVLIIVITGVLIFTKWPTDLNDRISPSTRKSRSAAASPSSSARSSRRPSASWACGWRRRATSVSPLPLARASARPCRSAIAPAPSPAC